MKKVEPASPRIPEPAPPRIPEPTAPTPETREDELQLWPDAETRVLALLGYPVSHSLSPRMHNTAFRRLGMNFVYLAFPVPPGSLRAALQGMEVLGTVGANITIPHKETAFSLAEEVTEEARMAGAVNTLSFREGRISGANTDVEGFARSLEEAGVSVRGASALLFGAGGAARAVAVALLRAGAAGVWVANRTPERARELARDLGEERIHSLPLEEGAIKPLAPRMSLVVNCTSLGMHPHPELSPWEDFTLFSPQTVVADVVYRPRRTLFLRRAEEAGLRTVDGTGMLIHQAAAAWRHWFGQPGPVDIFREVVESCLP